MSKENKSINDTIAKAVSFSVGTKRGRKSSGTKIGERSLDIPIIKIKPFSI